MIEALKQSGNVIVDDAHEWGYQLRFVNNNLYAGKFLVLENGTPGSRHYHKKKTETFVVIKGEVFVDARRDANWFGFGEFFFNGILREGDTLTLPKKTIHQMRNSFGSTSVILEVSTHDDDEDIVRMAWDSFDGIDKSI